MCGIAGLLVPKGASIQGTLLEGFSPALALDALAHRGPTSSKYFSFTNSVAFAPVSFLTHNRLAIVAALETSSVQPFASTMCSDGSSVRITCVANGELYNHRELRSKLSSKFPHLAQQLEASNCDVQLLIPAFRAVGLTSLLPQLVGDFAFAIIEERIDGAEVWLARDAMGVKPLYWSHVENGGIAFASELKALPQNARVYELLAGSYLHFKVGDSNLPLAIQYFAPEWLFPTPQLSPPFTTVLASNPIAPSNIDIRAAVSQAVRRRLMGDSDVNIGVLLSGGVDSSIIAHVAAVELNRLPGGLRRLHTFTVYCTSDANESLDRRHAAAVAQRIGSIHHEVPFSPEDGIAALSSVVASIEAWDVHAIRAAVPQYLLCKVVSLAGIKVVLCGEGADELFAGYALFSAYAPNELNHFSAEVRRRLQLVGDSELLRVDRISMAFGVEARVPFLDVNLLELCMSPAAQEAKLSHVSCGRIEKWFLRNAYAGDIPDEVLFRKKEQFADGVGRKWIPTLQAHASRLFPNQPASKAEEALYHDLCKLSKQQQEVVCARSRRRAKSRSLAARPPLDGSAELRKLTTYDISRDPDLSALLTTGEARRFVVDQLRCSIEVQPSKAYLDSLIRGSLSHIPFHNLTNLVRPRRPPTLEEIRNDMFTGLGGPCIVVNSFFAALLAALGFEVFLTPGTIHAPNCHVVLLVCVQGITYFVDVGNGKPYLEAVSLGDRDSRHVKEFAWKLHWNAPSNRIEVYHCSRSVWATSSSISFDPGLRVHFASFLPMVMRSRTDPQYGPFLSNIRLSIYPQAGHVVGLRNLLTFDDGKKHLVQSAEELIAFVKSRFPRNITLLLKDALTKLDLQDI